MTLTSLEYTVDPALSTDADVVVVGAVAGDDGVAPVAGAGLSGVGELLHDFDVSGRENTVVRLGRLTADGPTIVVAGLGCEVTEDTLRAAAGTAVRFLAGTKTVAFSFGRREKAENLAVAEGAALGAYAYTSEKGVSASTGAVAAVVVCTSAPLPSRELDQVVQTARAVHLVRDLGNTSAAKLVPEDMVSRATEAAADAPVTVQVWDVEALIAGGFGGLLGVGRGSANGPRLMKVEYSPEGADNHLALVGKGITYDTGGLSLKPPAGMLGMKYDMLGSATVLGTVLAAARLGIKTKITAWLCLAENMPSGSATRPGDVLTMRGGRTVEVTNTDAEGRLVMADGISAACEEDPDLIVDVATLTGAALVALGKRTTGVMGNGEDADRFVELADRVGEAAWRMPLPGELRDILDSDVADIMNANLGHREGGMLVAGHFLQEFVGTKADGETPIPWVHLDIAGTGQNEDAPYSFNGKGATGVMVRSLLALAEDRASA